VGKHFLAQLSSLLPQYPQLTVSLISRSTKSLYMSNFNDPGLNLSTWEQDLSKSPQPVLDIHQTLAHLSSAPGQKKILVDNTSSPEIASTYPLFLKKGISIITPNKKAFSGPLSSWQAILSSAHSPQNPSGGHIYHESSVGAGLPIISTLQDLMATGDTIQRIQGVFSGTMSFLFNNFAPASSSSDGSSINDNDHHHHHQSGGPKKWSAEVQKARDRGFTEPDPREDLNGVDVARKLVILARIAGLGVEGVDAFPVESLVPQELRVCESAEEFMARLPEFDGRMEDVKSAAEREGKVVRFVGSIEMASKDVRVGLEGFEKGHAIAGLKGSDNIVSFYTERYGENPLVVQGAGYVSSLLLAS